MKTSNQETSNPKIGLEKIIEILGEANPIDLDWEIFHRERAIKNYFDALPAENLTQKANQIIEEIRKIEDGIIKYIINDLTARTEQTIKEYKEKEQQILEEGLTQVKQTFTVQEIIAISQKSKNSNSFLIWSE